MLYISSATIMGSNKKVNQDAYGAYETSNYLIMVVADGLGSSRHSDKGSLLAIKSVKKAVMEWKSLKQRKKEILIQMIHFYWKLYIRDAGYSTKDCLTTCLFIYIDKKEKTVFIGQLGDGLIFFKSDSNYFISENNIDFNYTQALGSSKNINDWKIYFEKVNFKNLKCLIATDGVSEDIVNEKEEEFMNFIIGKLQKVRVKKRNQIVKNILKNWQTKFHEDDKTISILWGNK